jgi:hypothetical protein
VALTTRGKAVIGVVAAVVVGGLGIVAFTGNAPGPLQDIVNRVTGRPNPCPLTGEVRPGDQDSPARSVFAVKVENTDEAYPLAGLHEADVVYEEPVEGGITRFVVLYQCDGSPRVGPVRSARTTDVKILVQYADAPLLAYSGAAQQVTEAVDAAGIVSFTETSANDAFARDDARSAPHNLYVSVRALYRAARATDAPGGRPAEVLTFDEEVPTPSKRIGAATVTFSTATVADWVWSGGRWVRHLDGEPMVLEDGKSITADSVVVQEVVVTESNIKDASGAASPEVEVTGSGRAWVLRDGRRIAGRWERPSLEDVTSFVTKGGEEIALAPGRTFIQLIPTEGGSITFGR